MAVYTIGTWRVKRGREDEFVAAWRDMATRTESDFPGASAVLLRDRDEPQVFTSCGPWDSLEQIERWRSSETFADGVSKIRPLLDRFEPHTLDAVVTIGM